MDGKLSSRENVNQVTEEGNGALTNDVTVEEVKDIVFSMHPDKSPDQDDLVPGFYQIFWSIVESEVVKFYQKIL